MNLDQMMDAWRVQDQAPLYGVNRDLLQLVLQHERAELRRTLRKEQWITFVSGLCLVLFTAFWLWVLTFKDEPAFYTAIGAASITIFSAWVGAMWISRKRQARLEREFGTTLRAEVERNLSLVEYRLSNEGRWSTALLWAAPPIVGAGLLSWLVTLINHKSVSWYEVGLAPILLATIVAAISAGRRAALQILEPRRERLRALLRSLDAAE